MTLVWFVVRLIATNLGGNEPLKSRRRGNNVQLVIAHVEEDIIGKGGGPIKATEADADLIVAGTRGHSPVAGLLLGSVTQRLLHIARRPVLTVPGKF